LDQNIYDTLEYFPNQKIILTNANDEEKIKFGIINMPYEVFSLNHNPEKSDPKYFSIMLNKYKLKPENVIYIEHNLDAVKSALSLGINTHHYNPDYHTDIIIDFINKNN
jgi:HAD superfamily hydrolase (TIGR01509 family)